MVKKLLVLLALAFSAGIVFAVDPVEGYWLSVDDKTGKETAGWHIYVVEGVLYGKMLSSPGKKIDAIAVNCKESYSGYSGDAKVNTLKVFNAVTWIYGLKMKTPGVWIGGSIIDPKDGKQYGCEITFHKTDGKNYKEDTLEMRGKVAFIGVSQFWHQSTEEKASSLW
jgi:uncharacterized protein (DUF2147 family)